jgi:hypothetical protein
VRPAWCALALAALAGSSPRGDRLAFAVETGASVAKTFTIEHGLVAQKIQVDGEAGGQISQQGLEVASTVELDVVDVYRKVDAGRPLELQRLFQAGSLHLDLSNIDGLGNKHPEAWDAESPLQGKTIVCVWVPEEKTYGRSYDQEETLEEYLAGLSEDLDLRCLLPQGDVHEGSDWAVDPARLVDLFVPGGEIPLGFVKGGGGGFVQALKSGVGGSLHQVFGGVVKGNARAKWAGTEEVEGARLARIELAVSIETDHDRTEATRTAMHLDESSDGRSVDHAGVRWKFDGSGTLRWNLGAGRFEDLVLTGRQDVTSELVLSQGSDVTHQMLSMAGSLAVKAKASPKKKS